MDPQNIDEQGRGQYTSEGSRYIGMWKHDLMHGEGEFEKDGSLYKGEFFQGKYGVLYITLSNRTSAHSRGAAVRSASSHSTTNMFLVF